MKTIPKNNYLKTLHNSERLCLEQMTDFQGFNTYLQTTLPNVNMNMLNQLVYYTFIYSIPYLKLQPTLNRLIGIYSRNVTTLMRGNTVMTQLTVLDVVMNYANPTTNLETYQKTNHITNDLVEKLTEALTLSRTINETRDETRQNQNMSGTSFNPVENSLQVSIQALSEIMNQEISTNNLANLEVYSDLIKELTKYLKQEQENKNKNVNKTENRNINEQENKDVSRFNMEQLNSIKLEANAYINGVMREIAELFEFIDLDSVEYSGMTDWGYSIG